MTTKLHHIFLLIPRVWTGYAFLLHGTAKFFEFPKSMTGGNGSVELFSVYGIAGLLEIIFGVLIILGLFTKISSFILAGQMAIAYWFFHAGWDNFLLPLMNGGELASIYCMIFLLFFVIGAGKFSLDYMLSNRLTFSDRSHIKMKEADTE